MLLDSTYVRTFDEGRERQTSLYQNARAYKYSINCIIAFSELYVNAAFNKKKAHFTSEIDSNLRKKQLSVTS